MVNWATVCSPVDLGGLGIHDLDKFSRTLRLRWLWFSWRSPERPCVGTEVPCDEGDHDLLAATTKVEIGNGERDNLFLGILSCGMEGNKGEASPADQHAGQHHLEVK